MRALVRLGFVFNHLDVAPRHADVLMRITNTAGSIPGAAGIALTGWQRSGSFASALRWMPDSTSSGPRFGWCSPRESGFWIRVLKNTRIVSPT